MAMKKKTTVYIVSVAGKPGHGGRVFKEAEAYQLRDMLEKQYKVPVKIVKNWV